MKTKIVALFCACFLLLTVTDMFVPRTEAKIYDSVIRLHVLADDDSETAQNIKLLVRDAILSECGELFSETGDIIAASDKVELNLSKIKSVADAVLSENGAEYKSRVEWGYEEYMRICLSLREIIARLGLFSATARVKIGGAFCFLRFAPRPLPKRRIFLQQTLIKTIHLFLQIKNTFSGSKCLNFSGN